MLRCSRVDLSKALTAEQPAVAAAHETNTLGHEFGEQSAVHERAAAVAVGDGERTRSLRGAVGVLNRLLRSAPRVLETNTR